ncbi:hypothetical protein B0T14DRAFT_519726 [Immersiella caudata]|uniref:Uncharacterized protein n=1 Tax=Immersiella caudata TaxID=314043 RepID=A0AA39WQH0_9PEZI|nr:hypothetical protein B0T14DRAFT_519726 [Immersiella caudata]
MRLSSNRLLLALPINGVAAAPINATERWDWPDPGPCQIDAEYRDQWVEYGMVRYRTVFRAAYGPDPSTFCKYWHKGDNLPSNIKCADGPDVDGGWWRVDASFSNADWGVTEYWSALIRLRMDWKQEYGCAIWR